MEFGKPRIATDIDGITQVNLGITREMEHARQVVEYGLETSQTDGDSEGELLAEAIDNARTLLLGQAKTKIDEEQVLSRCIEALVIASWESYASLEISRIGLTAHLTRQQGSRFWDEIGQRSRRAIRAGSRRLRARAQQLFNWLLLQIGWRLPTRSLLTPVVKRVALAQVLEVASSKRDLPRIYRHLFRLAPVEDRRFLVGRDEELRGFEEAVLRWEQGHFGATLLVGAREVENQPPQLFCVEFSDRTDVGTRAVQPPAHHAGRNADVLATPLPIFRRHRPGTGSGGETASRRDRRVRAYVLT
jgi:hypothetical protein